MAIDRQNKYFGNRYYLLNKPCINQLIIKRMSLVSAENLCTQVLLENYLVQGKVWINSDNLGNTGVPRPVTWITKGEEKRNEDR